MEGIISLDIFFLVWYGKITRANMHKTKMIIINSPQNPTGGVLAEDDLKLGASHPRLEMMRKSF